MNVCLVDIGGIDDHHYLNFLFIMNIILVAIKIDYFNFINQLCPKSYNFFTNENSIDMSLYLLIEVYRILLKRKFKVFQLVNWLDYWTTQQTNSNFKRFNIDKYRTFLVFCFALGFVLQRIDVEEQNPFSTDDFWLKNLFSLCLLVMWHN